MDSDDTRKKIERSLKDYRANEEHYEMMLKTSSKMYFMRYTYLIEAGFGKQQAFEIIKARGME